MPLLQNHERDCYSIGQISGKILTMVSTYVQKAKAVVGIAMNYIALTQHKSDRCKNKRKVRRHLWYMRVCSRDGIPKQPRAESICALTFEKIGFSWAISTNCKEDGKNNNLARFIHSIPIGPSCRYVIRMLEKGKSHMVVNVIPKYQYPALWMHIPTILLYGDKCTVVSA